MSRTRRELLRDAGVLSGAAFAAAPAGAEAQTGDLLRRAVDLEQRAVVTYDAAAEQLDGRLARLARHFAEQEREHAEGLRRVLRHVRVEAPPEPAGPGAIRGLERALRGGPLSFARFAVRLERATVATYHEGQALLADRSLLAATASIMANEAQHLVLLRQALGQEPLPGAFETGRVG